MTCRTGPSSAPVSFGSCFGSPATKTEGRKQTTPPKVQYRSTSEQANIVLFYEHCALFPLCSSLSTVAEEETLETTYERKDWIGGYTVWRLPS